MPFQWNTTFVPLDSKTLAKNLGMVVTPGEFFGEKGKGNIRVAAVATEDRIQLLEQRAGV